jgi:hypothetical protein
MPATPVAEAAKSEVPKSATPTPSAAPQAEQTEARRPTATLRAKTGSISLSKMLSGDIKTASEALAEEGAAVEHNTITIDPQCQEKLTIAKDRIIERLLASRPRIGSRFEESMTVEGHTVRIEVQSQELFTEIMQQKSDLQKLFSEESGAKGYIELDVVVNEQKKVSRPITLEDRLQYLLSRNDRLEEMLSVLGLDAE